MGRLNDGDFIQLWGDIDHHYIKGYVSEGKSQEVLDFEFGDLKVKQIKHVFAFWGVGQDEVGEPSSIFYVRDSAGRGRFKVTEIDFFEKEKEYVFN